MTGNSPPPGWYTDGQGGQRWWDGSKWYEAAPPSGEAMQAEPATVEGPAFAHDPDSVANEGPKRKSSKAPRSANSILGLLLALAGLVLTAVATVLLIVLDPDCLNNEECGELSQSFLELFGIKLAALVAGLMLIGVGILLRRRARNSAGITTKPQTSSSTGVTTTLRRKGVWIPLIAVTCLALAAGTMAVLNSGPSDEERRIAAEKRESAAAAEAEQQEAEELAQQKATCESTLSEFKNAVEAVNSKLDVGLVQSDFGNALGDASVAYDQLDLDTIADDEYCLTEVARPLEQAFNTYVRTNNKWNNCITNFGCEVKGAVLEDMQTKWAKASVKILLADQALENYGSTEATES